MLESLQGHLNQIISIIWFLVMQEMLLLYSLIGLRKVYQNERVHCGFDDVSRASTSLCSNTYGITVEQYTVCTAQSISLRQTSSNDSDTKQMSVHASFCNDTCNVFLNYIGPLIIFAPFIFIISNTPK